MDTSGNIKRFAESFEAAAEGFDKQVTESEAAQLLKHPPEERQAALVSLRYRNYTEAQVRARKLNQRQKNRTRAKAARRARRKSRGRR